MLLLGAYSDTCNCELEIGFKNTFMLFDFYGINRFVIGPLRNLSGRFDFDFEFAETLVIENRFGDSGELTRLPRVTLFSNL